MSKQSEFIDKVKDGAITSYLSVGVLPSVTIAQSILESGWGSSTLSTKANNLFGIKGEYDGESVEMPTQEFTNGAYHTITAKFRKYPSFKESIEDHGEFLSAQRYQNLRWKINYKEVTADLHTDGYATAPDYANKLNTIIENYSLTKYDTQAFALEKDKKTLDTSDDTSSTSTKPETSDDVKPVIPLVKSSNLTNTSTATNDTTTSAKKVNLYLYVETPLIGYLDSKQAKEGTLYQGDQYVEVTKLTDTSYKTIDGYYLVVSDAKVVPLSEGGALLESYTS